MLECKKCGADLSSGEVKQGVSKDKTMPDGTFRPGGKPYKYVMCNCGNREFLPFGVAEKKPVPVASKPTSNAVTDQKYLVEINGKVVTILAEIKKLDAKLNALTTLLESQKACDEVGGEVVNPEDIAWSE